MRSSFLKIIIFVLLFLFLFCGRTEAHTLQIDGAVGAVLHIDPNDEPATGAPAKFYFDFKDTEDKFGLSKCDCTFSILENGNLIYSAKLSAATISYTFPTKGIYTVVVEGKPVEGASFQAFRLSYDIRVDKEAPRLRSGQGLLDGHSLHIVLFGGAILVSIVIVIRDKKRQKSV